MHKILPVLLVLLSFGAVAAQDKFATLPEQDIPIAYDVDVLVVGGSTGDVAAAVEAAKAGAKTMLITDKTYLGDDMTATLRLWLEPGEKLDDPLAAALYTDPNRGEPTSPALAILGAQKKIPFTYAVAEEIDKKHPENAKKNRLNDGQAVDPVQQSLQINGNATITLDLKNSQEIGVVSVLGFFRHDDFVVDRAIVSASDDEENWKKIGEAKLPTPRTNINSADLPEEFRLELDKPAQARFLKLEVKKTERAGRLLLGEVIVLPDKNLIPAAKAWKAGEDEKYTHPAPRPMHVKMTLEKELENAGVKFLYGCYQVGWVERSNSDGGVLDSKRGVVVNNRAGKQTILAKQVCKFYRQHHIESEKPAPLYQLHRTSKGPFAAQFVVVGGEPKDIDVSKFSLLKKASYEIMGEPFYSAWPNQAKTKSGVHPIIRYTFQIDDETGGKWFGENIDIRNELENQIRLATFDPDQQFTSDEIVVETDVIKCVSVPQHIAHGRQFGRIFAKEAAKIDNSDRSRLVISSLLGRDELRRQNEPWTAVSGTIHETKGNVKAFKEPLGFVKQTAQKIPVVGEYDVVVVGGGTTGAPAGIAAARQGAKTLVLEYLHDLGGVGTAGAISVYYWGNRVGFCKEVEDGKASWNIEQRIHWWRSKLAEAGGDAWYGILGSGTLVENVDGVPTVKGVLISTNQGPKVVLAKVVIDATGNGGIAASAGAELKYIDDKEIATQGHGLPPRNLGASYTNTDYMYVDETDMEDVTHLFVYGKEKFPKAFDFGKIIDTRERPQVVGDFTFTVLDQVNKRTYPDTIAQSRSNFDSHGYTVTPYMEIEHLHHDGHFCDMPLRSSLPKGFEGIFVGGLATSCHRDAIPIIRMQPDLQNQGYALGCIAAKASKENKKLRDVDLKPVQKHLVEIGNLPERVLTDTDNYEDGKNALPDAIKTIPDGFKGSAQLLWHPEKARPLLQKAYKDAEPENKLAYAMVLAGMNDPTGADAILDAVKPYDKWDPGWNFRGMGQFSWASSELDRYVMMLGRTRDRRGVPVICELLKKLKPEDDFSHHRAVALALEWIGDKSAAPVIAEHLNKPGMSGYHHRDLDTARKWDKADPKGGTAEKSRRDSLAEIGFARALYKLGDHDGVGEKILRNYSKDMRGYFSRHANEVLNSGKK